GHGRRPDPAVQRRARPPLAGAGSRGWPRRALLRARPPSLKSLRAPARARARTKLAPRRIAFLARAAEFRYRSSSRRTRPRERATSAEGEQVMASKTKMMGELRQMLRDVLAQRSNGASYAKLSRAQGFVDGYMR